MWLVVRADEGGLAKLRKVLKALRCFVREFPEVEYRVEVTTEERTERVRADLSYRAQLNPPRAWGTCASFKQVTKWDELGRGPLKGDCANPGYLHYISCPRWCRKYEPTSIDGAVFIAEQVAEEHEQRAERLRRAIENLKKIDKGYREAIRSGAVFDARGETFHITPLAAK